MLTSTGLRDDAGFAHAAGEQDLANGVVDLVGAGVQQILALEVDFCPTELLREPFRQVERRRTTTKITQQRGEFFSKFRILPRGMVFVFQFAQGGHQRLGDKHPAVLAEMASGVGQGGVCGSAHALIVDVFGLRCNTHPSDAPSRL